MSENPKDTTKMCNLTKTLWISYEKKNNKTIDQIQSYTTVQKRYCLSEGFESYYFVVKYNLGL